MNSEEQGTRARDAKIAAELSSRKCTLRELGEKYGLSRERIRQIANKQGVSARKNHRNPPRVKGKTCLVPWCQNGAERLLKTSLGTKAVCQSHYAWGEDIFLRRPFSCHDCGKMVRRGDKRCSVHSGRAESRRRYRKSPKSYWVVWKGSLAQQLKKSHRRRGLYRAVYKNLPTPWVRQDVAEKMISRFEKKFPGERATLERWQPKG